MLERQVIGRSRNLVYRYETLIFTPSSPTSKPSARNLGVNGARFLSLSVHFPPMSNPHNHNNHALLLNPIDDSVVSNPNAPVVSFALKFLHTRRKWVVAQCFNFG